MINQHAYGNGVAIFTGDGGAARDFASGVQIGMVGVSLVGHGPWRASLAWNGHFTNGAPQQDLELGLRYRW